MINLIWNTLILSKSTYQHILLRKGTINSLSWVENGFKYLPIYEASPAILENTNTKMQRDPSAHTTWPESMWTEVLDMDWKYLAYLNSVEISFHVTGLRQTLNLMAMTFCYSVNPFTHTFFQKKPLFLSLNVFLRYCVAKLHYILLGEQYFTLQQNFLLKFLCWNDQYFNFVCVHKPKFGPVFLFLFLATFSFSSCLHFLSFFLSFSSRYLLLVIPFLSAGKGLVLTVQKTWKWDIDQLWG